ncbi:galectin-9-like [Dreissena polymorpha]|uniref:galectin-9-like n=1 Tax=Dreissena polymorpha TaxID=45954 RepID=UPI002263EF5D|nr:galectin-9-like [Dreissena polymorpha]
MAYVIKNPTTPYVGLIPVGMTEGATIHVRGTYESHHSGFLISLQCGGSTDPRSDCALAFNPRFNEHQVVRNSLQSGSWGVEERHGSFPFQGENVDVSIVVHAGYYSVMVNGRHFCDYNHRIPLPRVSHISVEQGIRIREIVFETSTGYPHPAPGYPGIPTGSSGPVGSILHPPVPFVHNLGSVYPGRMIFISGIPHPYPSRFTVNFESKPNGPDIAFHCDFRFNFGENHNVIVRNTQTNNKWGPEERPVSNFPLLPNVFFEMIFLVEQHCFKVAVNNVHLLEYKHRLQPLSKFTFLRIDGDVRITQVRYQ